LYKDCLEHTKARRASAPPQRWRYEIPHRSFDQVRQCLQLLSATLSDPPGITLINNKYAINAVIDDVIVELYSASRVWMLQVDAEKFCSLAKELLMKVLKDHMSDQLETVDHIPESGIAMREYDDIPLQASKVIPQVDSDGNLLPAEVDQDKDLIPTAYVPPLTEPVQSSENPLEGVHRQLGSRWPSLNLNWSQIFSRTHL